MAVYCSECRYIADGEKGRKICLYKCVPIVGPDKYVYRRSNEFNPCYDLNTDGCCPNYDRRGFFKRLFSKKKVVETDGSLSLSPSNAEGQLSVRDD